MVFVCVCVYKRRGHEEERRRDRGQRTRCAIIQRGTMKNEEWRMKRRDYETKQDKRKGVC